MDDRQPLRHLMAADQLLLTPEEVAQVLRLGRTTVYALMKSGELRPVHIGRSCPIFSGSGRALRSPAPGPPVSSTAFPGPRVNPQHACSQPMRSRTMSARKNAQG